VAAPGTDLELLKGMGTQKLIFNFLISALVCGGIPSVADASKASNHSRIAHAKELLGYTAYKHSTVRKSESLTDIGDFVEAMTTEWLPKKYAKRSRSVATAIVRESEKRGLDPIFVLALIQNESRFNPEMRGTHTEIGLMQIKPTTAKWIGKKMHLRYRGEKTLLNPVQNIRFGVAFMSMLRDQFDEHSPLYISAYNMGARRVRQIVADDRMPKDYVQAVMKRYLAIYAAFAHEDAHDIEGLSEEATQNVLAVTRAIASN
jgi:soluble lytic murein transglycosylase